MQHPVPSGTGPRRDRFLVSKVTARAQTTLPSGVRKALGIGAGDRISYVIEDDHAIIRRVEAEEEDPALAGFLDLIEEDLASHPEHILFATEPFARYLAELTAGVDVDYDAPIEGDFEI